jgi:hypothetical protein
MPLIWSFATESNVEEIIQQLEKNLKDSYKDFEMLSLDWDEMDKLLKSMSEAIMTHYLLDFPPHTHYR